MNKDQSQIAEQPAEPEFFRSDEADRLRRARSWLSVARGEKCDKTQKGENQ